MSSKYGSHVRKSSGCFIREVPFQTLTNPWITSEKVRSNPKDHIFFPNCEPISPDSRTLFQTWNPWFPRVEHRYRRVVLIKKKKTKLEYDHSHFISWGHLAEIIESCCVLYFWNWAQKRETLGYLLKSKGLDSYRPIAVRKLAAVCPTLLISAAMVPIWLLRPLFSKIVWRLASLLR